MGCYIFRMRKADQKIVAGLWAPVSRSFIALLILTTMAYSIHNPFTEAKLGHFNFKFKFHLSFLWAVMTNFFIVAPKVGRWAPVSLLSPKANTYYLFHCLLHQETNGDHPREK